jgi:Cellulase (glycosyl hydrolase family 5)
MALATLTVRRKAPHPSAKFDARNGRGQWHDICCAAVLRHLETKRPSPEAQTKERIMKFRRSASIGLLSSLALYGCDLDSRARPDAGGGAIDGVDFGMGGGGGGGGGGGVGDGGAPPAPVTAQEAILLMQRGINLGNSFDAPPGETAWGNPEIQDYYFDDYKTAGFTAVRIPITWDQHTATTSPYAIDETFMSRVEQVVDWGLNRGLFIIMNAHHESWIKHDYSATNVARFDAIWTQISNRFKNKSDRLVFEILNEPEAMSVANLDSLNARILGIIRKTNPTRIVVYAGTNYSSDWDLEQVKVPATGDRYLIANFHCYSPWSFVSGGPDVIWGSQADKDAIKAIFDGVAQFVASRGIPAMVNEFGAGPNHDYNSRMAFYRTYVDNTIKHGMAFFAWDDGGMFRTYDRQLPQDHTPGGKWLGDVKDVMTKP